MVADEAGESSTASEVGQDEDRWEGHSLRKGELSRSG